MAESRAYKAFKKKYQPESQTYAANISAQKKAAMPKFKNPFCRLTRARDTFASGYLRETRGYGGRP